MAAMAISLFAQRATGSAWREMESWRAKQKQFTADFEAYNTSLVSTLGNTFSASNDGMIEITVRKALAAAQVRAAERAKLNGSTNLSSGFDLSV
jgi:hypothetical protein